MKRWKKVVSLRDLELKSYEIRKSIIQILLEAQSGHTAGPLGMADIFTVLYFHELKHDPKKSEDPGRDYVFLSNGHICPVLYATLAKAGYFPEKELSTFRKINSRLQGHPHVGALPGVENSGGPLGQGISQAVGAAAALKRDRKKNRVFCICGDGELNEGQCWEAALYAAKERLDNYVQIVDRNHIQLSGTTDDIMPLDPLTDKFRAFGFEVIAIDGNQMDQIVHALDKARHITKPVAIIAKTVPGKGVSFMESDYKWHGKPPNAEEAKRALNEIETHIGRVRAE